MIIILKFNKTLYSENEIDSGVSNTLNLNLIDIF
jgi:hypothetical protein